jgi:hypothetical protein
MSGKPRTEEFFSSAIKRKKFDTMQKCR